MIHKNKNLNILAERGDTRLAGMLKSLEEATDRLENYLAKNFLVYAKDEIKFIEQRVSAIRIHLNGE